MSNMIPCKAPSVCGVSQHRPGTIAACTVPPNADGTPFRGRTPHSPPAPVSMGSRLPAFTPKPSMTLRDKAEMQRKADDAAAGIQEDPAGSEARSSFESEIDYEDYLQARTDEIMQDYSDPSFVAVYDTETGVVSVLQDGSPHETRFRVVDLSR